MANQILTCCKCGKTPLSRDERGLNIKLIDEECKEPYCLDCMADYLDVDLGDLSDKIDEFKRAGCVHFK